MVVHLDGEGVGPERERLSYHCMLASCPLFSWEQNYALFFVAAFSPGVSHQAFAGPASAVSAHTPSLLLISAHHLVSSP